jgi:hypothetical protein
MCFLQVPVLVCPTSFISSGVTRQTLKGVQMGMSIITVERSSEERERERERDRQSNFM